MARNIQTHAVRADFPKERHIPGIPEKPAARQHDAAFSANGGQRKALKPGDDPSVTFRLGEGDEPVAVYAYCNLHGLWATEL